VAVKRDERQRDAKTYDPAPPNISLTCANQDTSDQTLHWMLAGRTG
jgi:hypothetical protein